MFVTIREITEGDLNALSARFKSLEEAIKALGFPSTYESIIDADVHFFGLVHSIVFEGKEINFEKKDALLEELRTLVKKFKKIEQHTRKPSTLKYLHERVSESISIYGKYCK